MGVHGQGYDYAAWLQVTLRIRELVARVRVLARAALRLGKLGKLENGWGSWVVSEVDCGSCGIDHEGLCQGVCGVIVMAGTVRLRRMQVLGIGLQASS